MEDIFRIKAIERRGFRNRGQYAFFKGHIYLADEGLIDYEDVWTKEAERKIDYDDNLKSKIGGKLLFYLISSYFPSSDYKRNDNI